MTPEEFAALPLASGHSIRYTEVVQDGVRVLIPRFTGGALFMGPDDGGVVDETGRRWIIGWQDGQRVKREVL